MGDLSNSLWHDRLDLLKKDLQRISTLLYNERIQQGGELAGKFTSPLSELLNAIVDLEELAKTDTEPVELWHQLARLMRRGQVEIDSQLEILGGLGISQGVHPEIDQKMGFDDGFTRKAEDWLNELRKPLNLNHMFVLSGWGRLLDIDKRIVRLPFLDWDYWHLPLLGRAIGLLATKEGQYQEKLKLVVDSVVQQVEKLISKDPSEPPPDLERLLPEAQELWHKYLSVTTDGGKTIFREDHQALLDVIAERQRRHLYYLFADIFATAVLGPVYAIAVFVMDLDYSFPNRLALENPDQVEGRESAPRFLPATVHRAAALLATLEAMDQEGDRPVYEKGPYKDIRARMYDLWREMLASARQPDYLEAVWQRFNPWFDSMYRQVICELIRTRIKDLVNQKDTETDWKEAQDWYQAFLAPAKRPGLDRPAMHILAGAMWLHRLEYPERADDLLAVVRKWRPDQWVPIEGTSASLAKVVADVRVNCLKNRWKRLEEILQSEQIPESDRAAVTGRLYRLLSEQYYGLERTRQGIQGDKIRFSVWGKIKDLYTQARHLEQETLEFLGGLLVHLAGLDREPVKITKTKEGPSICDLADKILLDYALRTGVNWNARTILGRNPFLEPSTDVIRVRFPDWSVWNLPLMAHEFGHVTALATPEFRRFQECETESIKREGRARSYHLDEFFADIFATYSFGPAFACDGILLQFNPAEAYLARGVHPPHDERVQAILATLERMNKVTLKGPWDEGSYGSIIRQIKETWQSAITACQVKPEDKTSYNSQLDETGRWARRLFRIVDTYYRFGAGYKPERWDFAGSLAENLLASGVAPDAQAIYKLADKHDLKKVTLIDVLNALWLARARIMDQPNQVEKLTRIANPICHAFAEE